MLKEFKLKDIKIIVVFLIYSLLLSFFYNYFVVSKLEVFDFKFKDAQQRLRVSLPEKDSYLVKIWGLQFPQKVYFNSLEVTPFSYRERGILKEINIKVDSSLANKGKNLLSIVSNKRYSVKIRNFYGATDSKGIIILFKSSRFLEFSPQRFIFDSFKIFIILILFGTILHFLINLVFLNFDFKTFFIIFCFSNGSLFLLFFVFVLFFSFSLLRVILSQGTFLSSAVSLLFLFNLILFYKFIFKHAHRLILTSYSVEIISKFFKFQLKKSQESYLELYINRLTLHYKKNCEQYLISLFILFLFMCMVFLYFRLYSIANWISYIAYFCLFGGLIIKYVKFVKEDK